MCFKVTGANKGIGYAVIQALCKQFDGDVFLTGEVINIISLNLWAKKDT